MCILHLDSQSRQYGGFPSWGRVFGRTPKLPIGAVSNPNFNDFMYQNEPQAVQTQNASVRLMPVQSVVTKRFPKVGLI